MKKLVVLLILVIFIVGCKPAAPQQPKQIELKPLYNVPVQPPNQIKIATFNVQTFGTTKAGNPNVMNILRKTLSQYDLISFQEIKDESNTAFPSLMQNMSGYSYIISDRLGRSSSKEQYAFIYNQNLEYIPNSAYVFNVSANMFERPPFIASFKSGQFNFTIIQIHTKPEDADYEIKHLANVMNDTLTRNPGITDIIIQGDLNADCAYYKGAALTSASFHWVVPDYADTNVAGTECAYDRIILNDGAMNNFIEYGVDRFDTTNNLVYTEAIEVSDHYPVYAIYNIWVN